MHESPRTFVSSFFFSFHPQSFIFHHHFSFIFHFIFSISFIFFHCIPHFFFFFLISSFFSEDTCLYNYLLLQSSNSMHAYNLFFSLSPHTLYQNHEELGKSLRGMRALYTLHSLSWCTIHLMYVSTHGYVLHSWCNLVSRTCFKKTCIEKGLPHFKTFDYI